jgi:hypothetical protein
VQHGSLTGGLLCPPRVPAEQQAGQGGGPMAPGFPPGATTATLITFPPPSTRTTFPSSSCNSRWALGVSAAVPCPESLCVKAWPQRQRVGGVRVLQCPCNTTPQQSVCGWWLASVQAITPHATGGTCDVPQLDVT